MAFRGLPWFQRQLALFKETSLRSAAKAKRRLHSLLKIRRAFPIFRDEPKNDCLMNGEGLPTCALGQSLRCRRLKQFTGKLSLLSFPWPSVAIRGSEAVAVPSLPCFKSSNTHSAGHHEMLHQNLTEPIIAAFYEVYHTLGHGFLESVYERAMVIAIRKRELRVERQVPVNVHFDGQEIGHFSADIIVEDLVTLELKACRALDSTHEAQLLNYLRATSIEVGFLLHFSPRPEFRRLIMPNNRKPYFSIRGVPRPAPDL